MIHDQMRNEKDAITLKRKCASAKYFDMILDSLSDDMPGVYL